MSWLSLCALQFAMPPAVAWTYLRTTGGRHRYRTLLYWRWLMAAAGGTVAMLAFGAWREAVATALSGVVALLLWWYSRRKRKRAAKLLGAKARALREKLVKSMPRWEPRLQGAGA